MNKKLKGYRTMAGYTQEKLAQLIGISRLSYILKENGDKRFSQGQEKAIFEVLQEKIPELTMEELFPIN